MLRQNILILALGVLLIFGSLYLFTRPVIFECWNFTNTGQIGDTIGGIAGPIINLIGAFLVYISFQAQINANRIQTQALDDEKKRNATNNLYEKHLSLFEDIKSRLRDLDFVVEFRGHQNQDGSYSQPVQVVYKGLNAINEYLGRIEERGVQKYIDSSYVGQIYSTYGIFLNFKFMLTALLDLIERIESNIFNDGDKAFLLKNIELFYKGFLMGFGERIIACYDPANAEIFELTQIKKLIDSKLGA